jgi:hypothetical protein
MAGWPDEGIPEWTAKSIVEVWEAGRRASGEERGRER